MTIETIENTDKTVFPYRLLVIIFIFTKYLFEQIINLRQLKYYMSKKIPPNISKLNIFSE